MGISKLLKFLSNDILVQIDLLTWEKPDDCRIGVDGYSWMYKILLGCNPSSEIEFGNRFMSKVSHLVRCGFTPNIVFDGDKLPVKQTTHKIRNEQKARNLRLAKAAAVTGDKNAEDKFNRNASRVTHEMVFSVIKTLERNKIQFVVAPYEADAQLAFLLLKEEVDVILTPDADLILYGCRKIIFDYEKKFYEYDSSRLEGSKLFCGFTHDMVLQACMLSGCDYLSSLPGVGLKPAIAALKDRKETMKCAQDYMEVLKSLKPIEVDENQILDYIGRFIKVMNTYKHQRVYDPTTKSIISLTPFPDETEDDQQYIGPRVLLTSPDTHEDFANGRIHPTTKMRMPLLV